MNKPQNQKPKSFSREIINFLKKQKDAFVQWLHVDPELPLSHKVGKYLIKFLGIIGVIALSPLLLLALFLAFVAAL